MRGLLVAGFLIVLVSLASAKHASISQDISEEEDKPIEPPSDSGDDLTLRLERRRNPCIRKKCYRGETCVINKDREATCICTPDCSYYRRSGGRMKVCSDKNDTYATECDLDRDHCLCKHEMEGCSRPGAKKIQVEYDGQCEAQQLCPEDEAVQFPARIRNWFFVVMNDMAKRSRIGEYNFLLDAARDDDYHSDAVIWKFCDLDIDPQDRAVSKRELQYTVRSLRALERCLLPFLDECDANSDKQITLPEWGKCLGLDHDKITDRCLTIHGKTSKD